MHPTSLKILFFFLLFQAGSAVLLAQNYRDSLDLELTKLSAEAKLPGLSVVIVNQDKIVYKKSLGWANRENKKPFTINTIENIGSVSKTFIAVALMKAIEKGYFTLETDINTILPFKVENPSFPNQAILIKHLVTHTSGIIDNDSIYHRSYLFRHTVTIDPTLQTFMQQYGYVGGIQDTTLQGFLQNYLTPKGTLYTQKNFYPSSPGTRSSYSNIGSALLAYLIEVKAGMSFADFTQTNILKPLRMHHSSWFLEKPIQNQHATPYFTTEIAIPFYSLITYPDGGLRTSAQDLSNYVQEMMRGLAGRSTLLDKDSYNLMFTPAFSADHLPENFSLKNRNKGVLWNVYNDGFIGHDGDDPGVSTNILFTKQMGIILMSNIYLEDRSKFLTVLKKYGTKLIQNK
ncbi:serine hydrolase domain-containing protein [Xanthocytophaga agilis]|uniref:Serine hydrolase domain-containing protein n=1 Tax=Xanthocytophaga agilis TaxID=3048010 RepID=A0AAE3UED2_9BACT|nr:serine hydrolase domain-containing protein [Xanthocytophaga agilis]MDJ1502110.1 serine hydrolase domain-containing protein [Xanthocytophaga agilis]